MTADGPDLLQTVKCNACQSVSVVLKKVDAPASLGVLHLLVFTCQRCKLVHFAEQVEQLLLTGPAMFGMETDDPGYPVTFFAAVDELYQRLLE